MIHSYSHSEESQPLDQALENLEQALLDTFGALPQVSQQVQSSEAEALAAIEREFGELNTLLGRLRQEQSATVEPQQAVRELMQMLEQALQTIRTFAVQSQSVDRVDQHSFKACVYRLRQLIEQIRNLLDQLEQQSL